LGSQSPSAPSDPADPAPATTSAAATASTEVWTLEDIARENDLVSLELVKWKLQIERIMASSQNLQRQRASYLSKADSTRLKTQELEKTLAEEKAALERKQRERGQMIKCDEVAKRIAARGRTKVELDE
jgi:chromosome segregation ATPase